MEFYCVKCREKVDVGKYKTETIEGRGGKRKLLRGECPKCGTATTKFAKM